MRSVAAAAAAALLAAAAPATSPPATPRVMMVGDSLTSGSGLQWAAQAWPERLANRQYGPDRSNVSTVAHPGQCLVARICWYGPPLVDTWPLEVVAANPKPSTVLLMIGRNDLAHVDDDEFIAALHLLVTQAEGSGIRVLVGTIPAAAASYRWASLTEPQRRRLNDRIRVEFAPFTFDPAASLGDPLDPLYDIGDGVHLTWPAQVVVADAVPLWWIR